MKPSKPIDKFIETSVRSGKFDPAALQEILDKAGTKELDDYWEMFAATTAFSKAQSVPDWKTKRQQDRFEYEHASFIYAPKGKDASGRSIVDRNELQTHVIACLNIYIQDKIEKNIAYKNSPAIIKIRFYFFMASLILIIPFGVISVLNANDIGRDSDIAQAIYIVFQWAMIVAWTIYIILCFTIPFVVWRKPKGKGKPPK